MTRSVPEWVGSTPDTHVPNRVKIRVYMRDGGCCKECTHRIRGGEKWICDHTVALINGGENRENNLRTICGWCDKKLKTPRDVKEKSKVARVRAKHLGQRPKSRMAGSRDSKWRKPLNGGPAVLR